ncbi:hypothetical protein Tco_0489261 [Tanacetum coccineum]
MCIVANMYVNKTLWLAYTSSMPPILLLPLSVACDDSNGCVTIAMAKGEIYVECDSVVVCELLLGLQPWHLKSDYWYTIVCDCVGWCRCDEAWLNTLQEGTVHKMELNGHDHVLSLSFGKDTRCKKNPIDIRIQRRLNGDCVPIARSCSGFDMCDQHQLSIRMPPGHCANTQNAAECFLSPECRTSQPYKFVIDVIDTPLPPVNARARKESNKGGGG